MQWQCEPICIQLVSQFEWKKWENINIFFSFVVFIFCGVVSKICPGVGALRTFLQRTLSLVTIPCLWHSLAPPVLHAVHQVIRSLYMEVGRLEPDAGQRVRPEVWFRGLGKSVLQRVPQDEGNKGDQIKVGSQNVEFWVTLACQHKEIN